MVFKGVTKPSFLLHGILNMFCKKWSGNWILMCLFVCLFCRKIIFCSEWKSKCKNSVVKMSWKCAFQARPPVAFRAVQFQLNFLPYVLSRLSPSLAIFCKNRQGSCSLQNLHLCVLHSHKLRIAVCSNYYIIFCLLVVFGCEIVLLFIPGKFQGVIIDQRKSFMLFYAGWF